MDGRACCDKFPAGHSVLVVDAEALIGELMCHVLASDGRFDVLPPEQSLDAALTILAHDCIDAVVVMGLPPPARAGLPGDVETPQAKIEGLRPDSSPLFCDSCMLLRKSFPKTAIVAIPRARLLLPHTATRLDDAGIHVLLDRTCSAVEMCNAIEFACAGKLYRSKVMTELIQGYRSSRTRKGQSSTRELSKTELEIATFLLEGSSAKEIARMRNTSSNTVRFQIGKLYKKAGVHNRVELIYWMKCMGYLIIK